MTFNIDMIGFPWLAAVLMVGAVLVLFLALLVASKDSRRPKLWVASGGIIFSILFGVGAAMLTVPATEQAEEIAASVEALPGVSSYVPLEKYSVPACNISTVSAKAAVSVITDDGEAVYGHLIVSAPQDGACTYELKMPTK